MSGLEAIGAISSVGAVATEPENAGSLQQSSPLSFAEMLNKGISETEAKVREANQLTRQFIEDPDSIAVHEVVMALEEARLAVDLALQVRTRVIESYREIMNMQL